MLNLGTLQFGIGVDTSGLTAAMSRVESFGRTVQGAQTAANRGFATSIATLRRQENTLLQGLEKVRGIQEKINSSSLSPTVKMGMINQLNQAYEQLSRRVTSTAAGLDPTKIDRASQAFGQMANNVNRTYGEMVRGARAAESSTERQVAMLHRAHQAAENLSRAIDRSKVGGLGVAGGATRSGLTDEIERATQRLRTQLSAPGATNAQAQAWKRQWEVAINDVRRRFQDMGGMPSAGGLGAWREGFQSLGAAALVMQGHLGGMSTRMYALSTIVKNNGLAFGLAAAGVIGFGAALTTMGQAAIKSRLVLEKMTYALTAVEGSTVAAEAALQNVRQTADRTGLSVESIASSYMRLSASGKAAGYTAKQTNDIFQTFAQASGTLALSAEDAQGVFRALDQMMSKGTVQAEELRGQLGDRLPGAFSIAAVAMGKTTAELNKMMKEGKLLSADFLPKFAEQVKIAFGLDTSKNVETLQANMNRLSNSWLFFGQAADEAFGITDAWIGLLKAVTGALNGLASSMPQVIQYIGALVGAMVALGLAMIAPTVLAGLATAWGAIGTALSVVRAATVSLTAAQMTLYAVMAVTPWGRLLTVLSLIVTAIAGAIFGYKALEGAVSGANDSMANNSAIKEYINQQKELGYRVSDVTHKLMLQKAALEVAGAAARIEQAKSELYYAGRVSLGDVLGSGGAARHGRAVSPESFRQGREQGARGRLGTAQQESAAALRNYFELQKGFDLPGAAPNPMAPLESGDGADKAKKAAERAAEAVRELMDALENAYSAMDLLFNQDLSFESVDAIMEARELLQGMSGEELAAFRTALQAAGVDTTNIEQAVSGIILKTNEATDAVQKYRSVVEEIEGMAREMAGEQSILDHLLGGGDPDKMQGIEALNQAKETLADFAKMGQAGQDALAALERKMAAFGFTTGTAEERLTQFNLALANTKSAIEAFKDMKKAAEELSTSIYESKVLLDAYGKGENVGRAAEKQLEMARKIQAFRKDTEIVAAVPGSNVDVEKMVADYARLLTAQDAYTVAIDKTKAHIADMKDTWDNAFNSLYDNLMALADGTKSFGEAIKDVALDIMHNITEKALGRLSDTTFGGLFGGGKEGGVDVNAQAGASVAAAASSSASIAVTSLATAATLAATSLQTMALAAGTSGGVTTSFETLSTTVEDDMTLSLRDMRTATEKSKIGLEAFAQGAAGILNSIGAMLSGGGQSIWATIAGAVVQSAGQIVGMYGGQMFGGSTTMTSATYTDNITTMPGRAMGGPVTKGWAYQVREQGAGDEVFIPGTSGFIGQDKRSKGGPTVYDMSTQIDARGATEDAIKQLRAEMAARDERIRSHLPYIIDSRTRENRQRLRQ